MASVKEVLTNFFKIKHFREMPEVQRARFDDLVKKGNSALTFDQRDWRDQLDGKPLPEIGDELDDEELKELYIVLNNVFNSILKDKHLAGRSAFGKSMDFVKSKTDDPDNGIFGNMFHAIPLSNETKSTLDSLAKPEVLDKLESFLDGCLPDGIKIEEFKKKFIEKKYETDMHFRQILLDVVRSVENKLSWTEVPNENAKKLLEKLVSTKKGLNPEPGTAEITRLKLSANEIMEKIYSTKALREAVATYDNGKITGAYETAKKEVNYDDGDNALAPKADDKLNMMQRLKKYVGDTYEDYLQKYSLLHGGDLMFFSLQAKDIVKGISKAKIKPTDGLDAVISKAEEIKEKINYESNSTMKHFNWFIDELKALKKESPQAFEGCLRNGRQLKRLVSNLMIHAVKSHKIAEAKTALEILSVIKYSNRTSRAMDAIRADKGLFTFLSNPDLSWNKNDAIKFITAAVDQSLRIAALGIGYTATVGVNLLRKSGTHIGKKYSMNADDEFGKAHKKYLDENETNKARVVTNRDAAISMRDENQNFVNEATARGETEGELSRSKFLHERDAKDTKTKLARYLQGLQTFLEGKPLAPEDRDACDNFIQQASAFLDDENAENIATLPVPRVPDVINGGRPVQIIMDSIQKLKDHTSGINDTAKKIQKYRDAQSAVESTQKEIDSMNNEIDTWDDKHHDEFQELIDHWNKLERGRDTHFGKMYNFKPGSKKKWQANFSKLFGNERTGA
ncbi:MAG: hypothetical protein K5912_00080 [Alphaproteobacteria bacterium]|nr:hypothetical protein [Alphaproteobacteria bacterium]